MSQIVVTFLTKPGCHLCEDARPVVSREIDRAGASMVETNIETEEDLLRDYGMRIPVVLAPDGRVLDEGRIDGPTLRVALRAI